MTSGLNIRGRFWRMMYLADDAVGGAQVSGTIAYDGFECRLTPQKTSFLLLEQGLEVENLWNLEARPNTMQVIERDEFEVTFPPNHPNINDRFRIIQVQQNSMHPNDSRGFLNVVLRRRDYAHGQQ